MQPMFKLYSSQHIRDTSGMKDKTILMFQKQRSEIEVAILYTSICTFATQLLLEKNRGFSDY